MELLVNNFIKGLKTIAIMIFVLLCIQLLSVSIYADSSGSCGDNLSWEFSESVLTITGSGDMVNYRDNYLAPWYEYSEKIKTVVLSDEMTSIGDFAFYNCLNLTNVDLPASIKRIGEYAFAECKNFLTIGFGSVESIGNSAFYGCESLTAVKFPSSLTIIGSKAFYRCSSIFSFSIPDNVKTIGNSAFAYCSNLVRVTVNAPLSILPSWTFYGCYQLTDVSLASSITTTSEYAFQGCESLNTVYTQSEDIDIAYQLEQSIINNNDTVLAGVVGINDIPESSLNNKSDGNIFTQTTVTDTGNAVISFENTSDSSGNKTVNDFTINSTVDNSKGWEDLVDSAISAESSKTDDIDKVNVNVQLNGSIIEDSDFSDLSGKDVLLNITTNNGSNWKIDMSQISEDSFKGSYDLGVSIETVDSDKVKINSETIFSTKFSGSTNFNASIGIDVDNAYQLATLYQKRGRTYEALQTVVVDENGKAWFNVANIDKNTDYFIGINSEGVTAEDAVIPESLYSQYNIDKVSYLTDNQGIRYELTGRNSKWGITGKQFAVYVGIAVGIIVMVVTVVMITFNKLNKSRAKYKRYVNETDNELVDEEAIKLQIMKEMLEEQKNNKK